MSLVREPEAIVARLRRHERALFWPAVLLIADTAAVAYFTGKLPSGWPRWATLIASAVILLLLVLPPVLRWLSTNYTITTRRVVIRSGVLVRHRQELLHSRGYDVTLRQTGLQRLFRSGDIMINTTLDRPIELRDVASGRIVQSALQDLMEADSLVTAGRRQQAEARRDDETGDTGTR